MEERKKLKRLEEKEKEEKLRKEREEVDKQLAQIKASDDDKGGSEQSLHSSNSNDEED